MPSLTLIVTPVMPVCRTVLRHAGLCEDPREVLCSNYTDIHDVHGNDVIKGLILWESPGSVFFANATLGESCHHQQSSSPLPMLF